MPDIFHERPRFPRGFRCASRLVGLKSDGKDLALFVSEVDAAAAAVFTRNHFPGAPVVLGRETIRGGQLRAVVVNSKVSNVATGAAGIADARRMAAAAAAEIGSTASQVLVSSTGVIGVRLPIEKIERGTQSLVRELEVERRIPVRACGWIGLNSRRHRGPVNRRTPGFQRAALKSRLLVILPNDTGVPKAHRELSHRRGFVAFGPSITPRLPHASALAMRSTTAGLEPRASDILLRIARVTLCIGRRCMPRNRK